MFGGNGSRTTYARGLARRYDHHAVDIHDAVQVAVHVAVHVADIIRATCGSVAPFRHVRGLTAVLHV
jgi:hypothetical protein